MLLRRCSLASLFGLALMGTAAHAEVTPGCLQVPFPTTPPAVIASVDVPSFVGAGAADGTARVQIWRQPCGGGDAQLVLTYSPLGGTSPVVSGSPGMYVQQNGVQHQVALARRLGPGPMDYFAGRLLQTTSFVLHDTAFGSTPFDDDAALTIVFMGPFGPVANVGVAAYGTSAPVGPRPLAGNLSGLYWNPRRDGEGINLEIARLAGKRFAVVTWYTYDDASPTGNPLWLSGAVELTAGQTSATIALTRARGGRFGAAYDPALVQRAAWGTITLNAPSCGMLDVRWQRAAGGSGELALERFFTELDGVPCG